MKTREIRKIYPYIKQTHKGIHWRRLNNTEIQNGMAELQKTCDCFSNATRYALLNSNKGREILSNRIKIDKDSSIDPTYKITLNVNKHDESYRVTKNDYFGKFFSTYRAYNEYPPKSGEFQESEANNLNTAFDIAIAKMIKKHPKEKPWYMRIYDWPHNKKYEYNRPSRAFSWLTGIKPIAYGENGLKCGLEKQREEVLALLNTLGNLSAKDYSFILMTGARFTPMVEKWHCVPITKVDNESKKVFFYDKRQNKEFDISFDTILYSFKAIVGINWSNSK